MNVWIARDKEGTLNLFDRKPVKFGDYWDSFWDRHELNKELYPEITWETEPIEFELKRIKE